MTALRRTLGIAVTALLLAAGPAAAGQRERPPGSTSGESGDRAVPRESGAPARESSPPPGPAPRESAPMPTYTPPADTSPAPRERAPRDNGDGGGRRAKPKETKGDNPNVVRDGSEWSRPRDDRPVTDTAVPRVGPRPPRDSGERNDRRYKSGDCYYDYDCAYPPVVYAPYYDPFAFYGCGYGLGYDFSPGGYYGYPLYSPYGFGYGMPYGYAPCGGVGGLGGVDDNTGVPSSPPRDVYGGPKPGTLKLDVKPRNAKVYVDGFYVGTIEQFSQKLNLDAGRHKVELKAEGFETAELDVEITSEKTVTFAGKMIQLKKVQ